MFTGTPVLGGGLRKTPFNEDHEITPCMVLILNRFQNNFSKTNCVFKIYFQLYALLGVFVYFKKGIMCVFIEE